MESKNIYQRMLAATAEINKVAKNLKVDIGRGSYKAVAEADVLEAVKPIEEKHGIYSYPVEREIVDSALITSKSKGSNDNGQEWEKETTTNFMRLKTTYRFVNVDKPEDFIDISTYGDGVDSQDKAPGKAMTYADKYALLKGYKIQTGDDPDAEGSKDGALKGKPTAPQIKFITKVQIAELEKHGVNLQEVATYYKVKAIEEIPFEKAANIILKKKADAEKALKEAVKNEKK